MALEEQRFKDGKIYRVVSEDSSMVSYGSTTQPLAYRIRNHKSYWRSFQKGNGNFVSVFEIFDSVGFDKTCIELVELYPCKSKQELRQRQRYYIENNTCVNRSIPSRTGSERHKTWSENNKDRAREIALASYYRRHEKVNAKMREKVECPKCAKMLCRDCLSRHIKMMHQ